MTMPIIDQNAKLNSPTGNKREENKQKEQKQHKQAELPLTLLTFSNKSKTQNMEIPVYCRSSLFTVQVSKRLGLSLNNMSII